MLGAKRLFTKTIFEDQKVHLEAEQEDGVQIEGEQEDGVQIEAGQDNDKINNVETVAQSNDVRGIQDQEKMQPQPSDQIQSNEITQNIEKFQNKVRLKKNSSLMEYFIF